MEILLPAEDLVKPCREVAGLCQGAEGWDPEGGRGEVRDLRGWDGRSGSGVVRVEGAEVHADLQGDREEATGKGDGEVH